MKGVTLTMPEARSLFPFITLSEIINDETGVPSWYVGFESDAFNGSIIGKFPAYNDAKSFALQVAKPSKLRVFTQVVSEL